MSENGCKTLKPNGQRLVERVFGFVETTQLIEQVFKDAILGFGLPDRLYCDNGSAFSSHYLARVCAHLNIGLVHSKPYDSPSRGKIERFFRTVREGFLAGIGENEQLDLKGLNDAFQRWLRENYHHKVHHGIQGRPIDRYQISVRNYPWKRVSEENLDEFFLVSQERIVNKDCTVSLSGMQYEVPPQYVGRRVELKFPQDRPAEVCLYESGIRIQRVHPVDAVLNGKTYQPTLRISDVALHRVLGGES
jgi:putative transposase